MNPFAWIIVFATTFTSPATQNQDKKPENLSSGKKPSKENLLSPKKEAQWKKWEKEWKQEEKENEDEILMEFLPTSNSQMPYKND